MEIKRLVISALTLFIMTGTGCTWGHLLKEPAVNPKLKKPGIARINKPHVFIPINCGRGDMSNHTLNNLLLKVVLPQVYNAAGGEENTRPIPRSQARMICDNIGLAKMWDNDWRATRSLMMPLRESAPDADSYLVTYFTVDQNCRHSANEIRDREGRVVATTDHKVKCKAARTAFFVTAWIEKSGRLLWWGDGDCGKTETKWLSSKKIGCGDDDRQMAEFLGKLFNEYPHANVVNLPDKQ